MSTSIDKVAKWLAATPVSAETSGSRRRFVGGALRMAAGVAGVAAVGLGSAEQAAASCSTAYTRYGGRTPYGYVTCTEGVRCRQAPCLTASTVGVYGYNARVSTFGYTYNGDSPCSGCTTLWYRTAYPTSSGTACFVWSGCISSLR